MFLLDSLLINGLEFVLDKVALAADTELDDESRLRGLLFEAQSELEAGTLSEERYVKLERDVLDRISVIRRRRQPHGESAGDYKVTGVDVEFRGDDDER